MRYLFGLLCVCALGAMPMLGCGDEGPECRTAQDCDDGRPCTYDRCDSEGQCYFPDKPDGTDCWVGRWCLGGSHICQSGSCNCVLPPHVCSDWPWNCP
jgi:hypothetical protein